MIGFRALYGRAGLPDKSFNPGAEPLSPPPHPESLPAAAGGEDEPAGVFQRRYRHSLWTDSEDCWLEDLFVAEPARRAGLGEALVACAIERARARGCGRIELDVSESNRGAWALYERMGFSPGYKPPAPNVLMGLRL